MTHFSVRFREEVLDPGNCTHCGACVGLCPDALEFRETPSGPLPFCSSPLGEEEDRALSEAWAVCPGRGVPYAELFEHCFGQQPEHGLIGPSRKIFTGYAGDEGIRKMGASGGVITAFLVDLLERGETDGCVVLRQGLHHPEIAEPVIATSRAEILEAAQSVYAVTPMLTLLPAIRDFPGRLAMVGLPEQVAAIRMLQVLRNPAAEKIRILIGPFTGTSMYREAVRAFLRGKGVKDHEKVARFRWRDGEWPGNLRVELEDGRVFEEKKFYYNYLIPFYISRSCRLTPDFTNELTDVSVGDAWSPRFEQQKGGVSIILARSSLGETLLEGMQSRGVLSLEHSDLDDVLTMHSHMFDFKKRGTFLRLEREKKRGTVIPSFGYWPREIEFQRRMVERVISGLFWIGERRTCKWLIEVLPIAFLGWCFDVLRFRWKQVSKPVKYRGLKQLDFDVQESARWKELCREAPRD